MKVHYLLIVLLAAVAAHAQPWHTQVLWQREGLQDSANYGTRIIPLRDQNNDGFDDWAVLGAFYNHCTVSYVELFHGGNPPSTVPYRTYLPDSNFECIWDIDSLGDVNGDGYVDYWLLAWLIGPGMRYLIFYGGPDDDGRPDSVLDPDQWYNAGAGVPIGDFNGDGYSDICFVEIAEPYRTQLFWGGQSDTIPDWTVHQWLGWLSSGNFDGNDCVDFTGAPQSDPDIYLGSANPDTVPDILYANGTVLPYFMGDFNGDGYDDLGWGEPDSGWVQYGGPQFSHQIDLTLMCSCQGYMVFPYKLGDVNRDGYDDIGTECQPGYFRLFLGGPRPSRTAVLTLHTGDAYLGAMTLKSIIGVGDVNGDGVGDFAISGYTDWGWIFRGRAVIFSGDSSYHVVSAEPIEGTPRSYALTVYPNPCNGWPSIKLAPEWFARGPASISVYNVLGQKVWSGDAVTEHVQIAQPVATGVYVVAVSNGQRTVREKFLVLK